MVRTSNKHRYMADLKIMYVEQEKSLSEISVELGPSAQTLSRWLREEGIPLQPRYRNPNAGRSAEEQAKINDRVRQTKATTPGAKGGGRKKLPRIQVVCAVCGTPFETREDQPKKTCSQKCGLWWANDQKMMKARQEWADSPASTCPCGETIPYANRNDWKYCSPECRETYGQKKQANPENYRTFTCKNCGRDVVRYKNLGSHKYCSNECARKHTKTKQHIVVDDATVLDSGFEALFWGLCMVLKIPVERYDRSNGVEWREGCWYAPDFYLPILKLSVELKGVVDSEDAERWSAFRKDVGKLVVLSGDDLRKVIDRKTFTENFR